MAFSGQAKFASACIRRLAIEYVEALCPEVTVPFVAEFNKKKQEEAEKARKDHAERVSGWTFLLSDILPNFLLAI